MGPSLPYHWRRREGGGRERERQRERGGEREMSAAGLQDMGAMRGMDTHEQTETDKVLAWW